MPNYQLGKIYQIVCLSTGEKYIGSTTEPTLARRLAGHCRGYKSWKNGTDHYTSSFPIIERGNYQIELIETFPCNSKDELNAREGHYIRTIVCINKCIPGRTIEEWSKTYYESNKEVILDKKKTYYEANKEAYAEQHKTYYEANKEAVAEQHKTYYEANKQAIADRKKTYYEANKQAILERKKTYRLKNKPI